MFTPEGAPMRAQARPTPPPKFNQNLNQESTIFNYNERNFSCSSDFEEEGTTELADYFSNEEDDSLDNEDLSRESDTWSQSDFDKFGEITDEGYTWSEFETNKFGLETINETNYKEPGEQNNLKGISILSEETALAFSAWQRYIPPEPVFQNLSAQSWRSAFSQQTSLSQEPTLIQIATIRGPIATTRPTIATTPTRHKQKMTQSQHQDWRPFRPATKRYTHIWRKPWPELSKTSKRTKSLQKEFQDHPEQSKPSRLWKRPSRCSPETVRNRSTKPQNMPPGTDVGGVPQVFTLYRSRSCLSMTSRTNTTKTRSWDTKWHESCNKIRTCQTKSQKNTEHHKKNSKTTLLWPWSPKPWPPTCSSDTTTAAERTLEWKISQPFFKKKEWKWNL